MKTPAWIVVADSVRARAYAAGAARGALNEVAAWTHEPSRQREQDLVSVRPGRTFDSVGGGRHALEPGRTQKRHEAEAFAGEIADALRRARNEQRYESLVLVAAPEFLGLLRAALDAPTGQRVAHTIDKNLTELDAAALRAQLVAGGALF